MLLSFPPLASSVPCPNPHWWMSLTVERFDWVHSLRIPWVCYNADLLPHFKPVFRTDVLSSYYSFCLSSLLPIPEKRYPD